MQKESKQKNFEEQVRDLAIADEIYNAIIEKDNTLILAKCIILKTRIQKRMKEEKK